MDSEKSKILIFGATGYLGEYMVKASLSMGRSTYAYVRPLKRNHIFSSKLQIHKQFQSLGVTVFQGELEEHEKLVSVLKQVDVVISTLAVPQHLDQLKIISAMTEADNIKKFVPSEFGNEVDRVNGLPPFEAVLANKRRIKRATEAAGVPYTCVSANSFAAYFIDYLLQPHEKPDQLVVYGRGDAKDVAAYTVRAATDPRVANSVIIYQPPRNIVSQLDLISSWEKKTGRTFKKIHVPEEEIVKLSETLTFPENIPVSILHNIFIKGDQMSFELTEDDLEASKLYPDHKYTPVDSLFDLCLINPLSPNEQHLHEA
ncbi:hypothetical protein GH714_008771 [Hevea brasiliensis]|uniref:NmrA-like domain-containing protein n=1 Tax=Hevea brasiliensis TaxID=3981 RepID=A0A6A6N7S4_HEVBR|nr:hypothetical protein GH714_008771 [Hevea brasiliensis]